MLVSDDMSARDAAPHVDLLYGHQVESASQHWNGNCRMMRQAGRYQAVSSPGPLSVSALLLTELLGHAGKCTST